MAKVGWSAVFPLQFTITGPPCSYKNSKRIVHAGKWPKLMPSDKSEQWMKDAVRQLGDQWEHVAIPRGVEVNAAVVSYLPTRRLTDADNLLGGPGDALQQAGVLEDDVCIASHDGSRRRYDKHKPRVEITLTLVAEPAQGKLEF